MACDGKYEASVCIPLTSERKAQICYDVLRVDNEPPRSKVSKDLQYNKNCFSVKLSSPDLRQLRVALTSFMEHLQLVVETLDTFGLPISDHYDHYKGSKST